MKKLIAILLLTVMCVTLLASCNTNETDTGDKDTSGVSSSAGTVDQGDGAHVDKLVIAEDKYDGYTYTVLITGNIDYKHGTQHYGNDFYYDDSVAESLSEAKKQWIMSAEAQFDIEIDPVDKLKWSDCTGSGNGFKEVQKSSQSGDLTYDSCMIGAYDICTAARNGYLADLHTVEYINLNNSWWDQVANKDLNIQGKMYYTTGDISIVDNVFTHCVLFNKNMIKEKNMPSPYTFVDNNEWTLDKFAELIRQGADTSGEGMAEDTKVYGLLTWNDSMLQIMAAADERIASVDESGNLTFTMYNDRTQTLYDKFSDIAMDTAYSVNYQVLSATGWDELRKGIFDSNRALFYVTLFSTITHHRDSETDFGVLPYPKLDATQENYGHLVSSYHTEFFCIPRYYETELVSVGSVSEYMAYMGQKLTKPAYYDDTLVGKYVRDDESAEMLDIIFASRVYDVGTYYKVGNIPSRLGGLYKNTSTTFQQIYQENGEMAKAVIDTINNQFMNDSE